MRPAGVAVLAAVAFAGTLAIGRGSAPAAESRAAADPRPRVLESARQLLVVTTPDWDAVSGELRRYERASADGAWQAVGAPVGIVVGKNGMAWDPGVTPSIPGPTKREGDGRSPAGAFALGPAFGLAAPAEATWLKLPYVQEVATLECVDDVASAHYNRLVDRTAVASVDWTSSEKMAQVGEAYRWGVVVEYNTATPVPGQGSCIFLHVSPTGAGTAGCTAMAASALDEVMRWLDARQSPVLVQMPTAAMTPLVTPWKLPA
jgi:D-alanyl-D-alanine dipeptidase